MWTRRPTYHTSTAIELAKWKLSRYLRVISAGWDEDRVRNVLGHYEEHSEEATTEDEAALEDRGHTFMEVPNDLVPRIRLEQAHHMLRPK
jgi:hypothetical protein